MSGLDHSEQVTTFVYKKQFIHWYQVPCATFSFSRMTEVTLDELCLLRLEWSYSLISGSVLNQNLPGEWPVSGMYGLPIRLPAKIKFSILHHFKLAGNGHSF